MKRLYYMTLWWVAKAVDTVAEIAYELYAIFTDIRGDLRKRQRQQKQNRQER